ncbi:hypothetical protein GLOIN_2v1782636 [Rhizophagus irregularis DAOM 181602=DAOM 197198]|uniref:BAH domain-containing protein n=1 Tax=Rhizophagus irregularis (strain DAOM 181602 / DAOM 197198 / MUCL 43194) TaxID=747089 RepID=A0A2P4PGV2_RHIID|nr:hypothetical protein GLOIN_2v1782636 [Rhizophagus irregularis DAOM 181602=DAOM 197198]POG64624.1 hypothetical protein GLOIN_2v1782636 [Rhizophagus irregularis DAOM 181602=DAOM 197198]|eukprot:XP_025171490.1 hypothetical protein GLOIN_2v1782636 [Rhizophagus irregularis DAOM 181602=DAOM 197198]
MKSVSREGRKFTSEFYQAGNFILYNSQEEAGDNQRLRQINAVWLTENREAINVDCVVVHHVKVWLENLPESENYDYRIREILYIHNNRSKIRQIHQQHQLPNQHNFQRLSFPLNLQHLKFFIDLYYNDFDAFGKSYYKLGGIYIQFGNMPLSMRQCFKNYFLIGLIPFDAKFADFIKPFIQQMQILQNGIIMTNYNGDKVIISGGLGMCIPQGNNLAGIRRHNTDHGCRTCEVTQEDLNNTYFDIQLNGRYFDEYNDYILLKKRLEQVTEALLKVFRETFSNLPNLHALHHLPEIARNFGMLVNTSVSLKEAVHGLYKRTVLHTNKKDLSMDLSKRDNTLQTLRYLLDEIFSIHPDFQNIQVYGLWKQFKIQEQGLSTTLSTENLLTEITKIYKDVYKNFSAIIQRRVNYYDSIQFTVHLESDVYVNITLRVGEAIDVEVADSHGEQSYALIRVIMIHQDDSGNNNPFLLIDWFYRNGNVDSVTGFPIYGLQKKRCRFMVSPSTSNNSRSTT